MKNGVFFFLSQHLCKYVFRHFWTNIFFCPFSYIIHSIWLFFMFVISHLLIKRILQKTETSSSTCSFSLSMSLARIITSWSSWLISDPCLSTVTLNVFTRFWEKDIMDIKSEWDVLSIVRVCSALTELVMLVIVTDSNTSVLLMHTAFGKGLIWLSKVESITLLSKRQENNEL